MIQPLFDNVLLEKQPSEKKVGSIVLTTEKKQGNVATVLAVGEGKLNDKGERIPTYLVKGDKVIYRDYAGTEYEEDGHKYLIIKEEDVLAIIKE